MKYILILLTALLLGGCAAQSASPSDKATYRQISMEEAVTIMAQESDYIILDVRRADEFASGHIPGAIVISHEEIAEKAEEVLTDKDQLILVYCRSGRRSKIAAEALMELGYTSIKECGGIIDWPYETE